MEWRVQLFIVHQIRNSLRYVPDKDKNAVMADMKPIYNAINEEPGNERLLGFEQKWGKKYPLSCKSWMDNWLNLSAFYEYDSTIPKIIYTANPIEGVHRQLRKITKSKGAFNSDPALLKLMYLIVKDVSRKWAMPIHNWGMAFSQLYIKFGNRFGKEGINN